MGWYLDGRVTACVGTHTHVPTADARVLPGGTAYITDVGMTGPRGGVIGVKREQALERFLTLTQVRFETADEDPWLNGVLVGTGGRATTSAGAVADRAAARFAASAVSAAEASPPARTGRTRRRTGRTSASSRAAARSAPRRRAPPPARASLRAGRTRRAARARARRDLDRASAASRARRLPPDAERRGAAGLVADRAVVELAQAAVGTNGSTATAIDRQRRARRARAATPAARRRANSGASASGANFAAAPSPTQPRRARERRAGASVGQQRGHADERDERVVRVRLEHERGVRVGRPGVGERHAERACPRAPAAAAARAAAGRRSSSRSKAIAAPCAAGRSSQRPLHGHRLLERARRRGS